jgi:hypothetical protein
MAIPARRVGYSAPHAGGCKPLNETLQEEMNAEKLLTQIAKSKADKAAAPQVAA